jgi:uncharacterized protein YcgI (DUF1989 family)
MRSAAESNEIVVVPASEARGVRAPAGATIEIVDLEGGQVGDLFVFAADDPKEFLSASHTRAALSRIFPRRGEAFWSTRRRPIVTFVDDTSPGLHDLLVAACDSERYRILGVEGWHASCAENLERGASDLGFRPIVVPQPINVFMDTPVLDDGTIDWRPAQSQAGDRFVLRAEMEVFVVLSACPQDLIDINPGGPTSLGIRVLEQA